MAFLNLTRTSSGTYSPDKAGRGGKSVDVAVAEFSVTTEGVDEGRLVAISVDSTVKVASGVFVEVGEDSAGGNVAVGSKVSDGVDSLP